MSYCKLATYGFIALISAFILTNSADAAIRDSSTGQSFPDSEIIQFEGNDHTLEATGVATRRKFFAKIYSVAHYMEDPQGGRGNAVFDEILNSDKPKQLSLKWVRTINGKKVQDGYKESFDKVVGRGQGRNVQSDINQFIGLFNRGVNKGDSHKMNWLPDGTVEVIINGNQVGTIKNKEFAKTLWSIWFDRESVVDRNDLISRIR